VPGQTYSRIVKLSAVFLLAIHVALVFRHFPPRFLRSGEAPCSGDLCIHLAGCYEGSQALAAGSGLCGYSPTFMAGYPFGAWDSFSRRGYEFATRLFPGCSLSVAFYGYIVLSALLPPLLILLAAYVMGCRGDVLSWCAILAVALHQAGDPLAYFWTFGNLAFPLVNALGVLCVALAVAGLQSRRPLPLICAGLTLGLAFWLHQIAAMTAAVGLACTAVLLRRDLADRRMLLAAVAAGTVALLAVLPWVAELAHFAGDRMPRGSHALPTGWKYMLMDLLSDRAYRHHFDRRALLHLELVLVGAGGWWALRCRRHGPDVLAITALIAFAWTYLFGVSKPLRELEPYRFLVSSIIFGIIPAAAGAEELAARVRRMDQSGRLVMLALGLVLTPSLTAYGFDVARRDPAQGLSASQRELIEWVRESATEPGRILCDEEMLGDMLPVYTGREVLGGSLTRSSPLKHRASWMNALRFFPGDGSSSADDMDKYLKRYNVAYVVVRDCRATTVRALPGVLECFRRGDCVVYGMSQEGRSWICDTGATGAVTVVASFNRILIDSAPAGRFTLKYHFLDSLSVKAGIRLYPVTVGNDPVPLIGVDNGCKASRIEIQNRE
jgi:hypothetical protein